MCLWDEGFCVKTACFHSELGGAKMLLVFGAGAVKSARALCFVLAERWRVSSRAQARPGRGPPRWWCVWPLGDPGPVGVVRAFDSPVQGASIVLSTP